MAEKKTEFFNTVENQLKKLNIPFNIGAGYKYYKGTGFKKTAYVKFDLAKISDFSLAVIADSAMDLGMCVGYKVSGGSVSIDAGVLAPYKELKGLKDVKWGFFVGTSIAF